MTIKGAWRGIYNENGGVIDNIENVDIEMNSPDTFPKVGIYNFDSKINTINNVTIENSAYIGVYNKGGSSVINKIDNSFLTPKATFTQSTGTVVKSVGLSNSGVINTVNCSNTITGNYLAVENHHGGNINNNLCSF